MNKVKLNELIKKNNYIIPFFILEKYQKFNLTLDEYVMLIYLYNKHEVFSRELISKDLGLELIKVMELIDSLTNKGFINLDIVKTENGIMEEKINLDSLYEKISNYYISELNEEEENDNNIFKEIEEEFNHKLKPMEQEMVIDWQKEYSDELIHEALKEVSLAGSTKFRDIDKVLFEWKKQGIKNLDDIKKLKEISKEPIEVYNCDWLNDDGEI